ncbi:MAG: hypothetical protein IKU65_06740 [Oscillospiraceae bacterium]|nr:hypothetical protein [Oscillospiraceae bacterium]
MKRIIALFLLFLVLFASCAAPTSSGDEITETFRTLPSATYAVSVTSSFPSRETSHTLEYIYKKEKQGRITVIAPEDVKGIALTVQDGSGTLSFDGAYLETGPLDASGLSPFSALPALMNVWQEGNFREIQNAKIFGQDSFLVISEKASEESILEYRTWFSKEKFLPLFAEIFSDGKRVIQCKFERAEHT